MSPSGLGASLHTIETHYYFLLDLIFPLLRNLSRVPRPRNLGRVPHLFGEVSDKSMAAFVESSASSPSPYE